MSQFIQKSSEELITNVVGKERMREFQSATLKMLSNALINSFGPRGSNTIIKTKGATQYTKDGKMILESIQCQDVIEESTKENVLDVTIDTVKKVGDGTTSATLLANIIFDCLKNLEKDYLPYQLNRTFMECIDKISEEILSHKQEFNAQSAYDITLISTNGNKEIANCMKTIYENYGSDVFIDVAISTGEENIIKEYDGMTLEEGMSDPAYINTKKGTCELRNPKIYAFEDPIDTVEMATFLDTILMENIYGPLNQGLQPIPTLILSPKISRDLSTTLSKLVEILYKIDNYAQKPPILIVTNLSKEDLYNDITRLCGCKMIRKYIDLKQQEMDIEKGIAPTPETIHEFAGSAKIVEADEYVTKFINPSKMHDENGELSKTYMSIKNFLEAELKVAQREGKNNNVTGNLKRRLNSLKCNLVEFHIGGISIADRDSVRHLVEDAVLNCRAAAQNGVGYAANFEGFRASQKLYNENPDNKVYEMIYKAYYELLKQLYSTALPKEKLESVLNDLTTGKQDMPYNIVEEKFDNNVICSITTDKVILSAVGRIISLMFTANQFICPSIAANRYL